MKNKKGFTLLELLAVLIILGILMVLAYMGVSRYIRQTNDALYEDYEKNISTGATNYLIDHTGSVPLEGQTITEKTIDFINRIKKVKTKGRPTDMDYVQIINWILSKSKDKEFAERIDVSSFVYEHTKELPRRVLFKILEI